MGDQILTIQLPEDMRQELERLAKASGLTMEALVLHALSRHLAELDHLKALIAEAEEDIRLNGLVDHDVVVAEMDAIIEAARLRRGT